MQLAQRVAEELSCADGFVSGEALARQLGVSRAAVWKAVSHLKDAGMPIEGVRNKGYRLADSYDVMSQDGIAKLLGTSAAALDLRYVESTTSTNDDAKRLAREGHGHGTVVVAGSQSKGKGRRGRSFFSPVGCGVYLTMVVTSPHVPSNPLMLTVAAALAACEAIEQVFFVKPRIKWVNDIYLGTRKACGILTEAEADLETSGVAWAASGIGFNVYEPVQGWPEDLAGKATGLSATIRQGSRNALAAATIDAFYRIVDEEDEISMMGRYRSLSNVIGNVVTIRQQGHAACQVRVIGIDDDLALKAEPLKGAAGNVLRFATDDTSLELA